VVPRQLQRPPHQNKAVGFGFGPRPRPLSYNLTVAVTVTVQYRHIYTAHAAARRYKSIYNRVSVLKRLCAGIAIMVVVVF
jgi:hypothetical protein